MLGDGKFEFTILNDKGEVVKVIDFNVDNALAAANIAIPIAKIVTPTSVKKTSKVKKTVSKVKKILKKKVKKGRK